MRRLLLGRFVLLAEVEHADLYLGTEVIAHGELLQVFGNGFRGYVIHLQYARGSGRAVFDDSQQRMGGRDAPGRSRRGEQLLGEIPEESLRRERRLCFDGNYLAFDAQAYLIELPVFETGG